MENTPPPPPPSATTRQKSPVLIWLKKHTNNCLIINGKQAINMPKEGENILKLNNFHKKQVVPFAIYANLEAITKKVQDCKPNGDKSYTEAYQTQEDC